MAPLTVATPLDRQILDALPITIYAVDLDGRITFVNRAWTRFASAAGATEPSDPTGMNGDALSIWEAMSELAPRTQIEDAMGLLRAGHAQTVTWEFSGQSPDGDRSFLMQISPLAEGHSVTGFVFATVEITQNLRAREVLIDAGMALAQALTVDRVFQEVTQQLRRTIGCDAVAIALAHDDAEAVRLAYQVGFEQEQKSIESILVSHWRGALESGLSSPQGAPPRATTRMTDIGAVITAPMISGAVRGAISALVSGVDSPQRRDEMERALATVAVQSASAIGRAEQVTRIAEKRRLEAIGEVAAGVAHELRNPLFGISSAAQLLRFRVREDPVIEMNVGRILREVERLNGMVTSLLEYGRPAPTRLSAGDPDEVWDEVLAAQRGLLESKALVLRHARAQPRVICNVDRELLAQVLVNVLVNAIDAAPEGSDLSLTSAQLPNGSWRCRLHNLGPAIAPDVLPRVFELFFSTKPGGTGIGLALCQRTIEEHGGTIAIESARDTGTTVTIVLPSAERTS